MKKDLDELAWIFKALGYKKRLEIIDSLLRNGASSVTRLAEDLHSPYAALSQNLAILGRAGFVSSRRAGNNVIYKIKTTEFSPRRMLILWIIVSAFKERTPSEDADMLTSCLLTGNYRPLFKMFGPL